MQIILTVEDIECAIESYMLKKYGIEISEAFQGHPYYAGRPREVRTVWNGEWRKNSEKNKKAWTVTVATGPARQIGSADEEEQVPATAESVSEIDKIGH